MDAKKLLTIAPLSVLIFFIFSVNSVRCQTPSLVKDIYNGTNNSPAYTRFIVFNNTMLFVANDGVSGNELWSTDGTSANTFLVKDINVGSISSEPNFFFIFNNEVFFVAKDDVYPNNIELWKTDGTTSGTVRLSDCTFDNYPPFVWQHNGYLYFVAGSYTIGGGNNKELWRTDGTIVGTNILMDINPGSASSNPTNFYEFNNELYFKADDGVHGEELWKTDGTSTGTLLLKDINSSFLTSFYNMEFKVVWQHNGFFFFISNTWNTSELWKSDGTTTGTQFVQYVSAVPFSGSIDFSFEFNNELFFCSGDQSHGGELWKTDGTTAGTLMVKDILPGSASSMGYLRVVWQKNGFFFFSAATNSPTDAELWKSDGTAAGTQLVKDINLGSTSGLPWSYFYEFNNEAFFCGDDGIFGPELWKTDGTNAGTVMVKDLIPGIAGNSPLYLNGIWQHNGYFFFLSSLSTQTDPTLWKSDGTTAGTQLVKDVSTGSTNSEMWDFYELNNELIFYANDGLVGRELWKTDGTTSGTVLVKDILTGTSSSLINSNSTVKLQYNGYIYFSANTSDSTDLELWKSDGTTAGTVLVQDIYAGSTGSNPGAFKILANDFVVFFAADSAHGIEPWSFYMPGVTAIEEKQENSVTVFPNPSVDMLTIHSMYEIESIQVFNIAGKKVMEQLIKQKEFKIDISMLNPSMYFLILNSGNTSSAHKVIKW